MFDSDRWVEIWHIVQQHRLRTLLTSFGVFWGILMLVVLLGMGKGLENGMMQLFKDQDINAVWLGGDKTSMPYRGLNPGRPIQLTLDNVEVLAKLAGIEAVVPVKRISQGYTVRYASHTAALEIFGIYPENAKLAKTILVKGRTLNPLDIAEARKVAVLSTRVADVLFGREYDPVGRTILINDAPFLVVGTSTRAAAEGEQRRIYIPFSTLRTTFDPSTTIDYIGIKTTKVSAWKEVRAEAIQYLANCHGFDPADSAAVFVWDYSMQYEQIQTLLAGIRLFLGIVGIGTLLAGCIGLSNTMLVSVKERTKELGIRKAVGASPYTILAMILQETLLITTAAGGVGLIAGIGLIEAICRAGIETEYFRNPHVDLPIAMGALTVLIFAGLVAGYLPASQAVRVQPIEALRYE
jgi:putative ABC transport system permease protein